MSRQKSSTCSSNKSPTNKKSREYLNKAQVLYKLTREKKIEDILSSDDYEDNDVMKMFKCLESEQNIQVDSLTHRDLLSYIEQEDFI